MKWVSDAGFLRAIWTPAPATSPSIEARINLTASSPRVQILHHDDPFMEDSLVASWPPISGLTFELAMKRLRKLTDQGVMQMTFRRPLHPCVSEDLYQFEMMPAWNDLAVLSIGTSSYNICHGFITEKLDYKLCPDPTCLTEVAMV
ncbi:unnamed protein product [Symbiodinium sp. CCMP2592]|nr:unnamed protein product [Symbiodinium sp. CCMP2592]